MRFTKATSFFCSESTENVTCLSVENIEISK